MKRVVSLRKHRVHDIEIDGLTFMVSGFRFDEGVIDILLEGGYIQNDEGDWWKMAHFLLRSITLDGSIDGYYHKFEIDLTEEDMLRAKGYRAKYPLKVPD